MCKPQDIDIASMEPIQIDYYIKEVEGIQRRKWVGRHDDAFADIFFAARTGIQIPTLHEMCRETLNPHIDTGTSNLNVQIVFVL